MEEILHYENVTFKRNGREILKGIDWHINKSENWTLLGLNGSGKSTLLGMIPAYKTDFSLLASTTVGTVGYI